MSLKNKLLSELGGVKQDTLAIALSLFAMLDQLGSGQMDDRAQGGIVGSVITVVIVGVVGVIGILIFAEVNTAIDFTGASNSTDAAATSLEDGFGSAMELLPIVMIVLVASLVIAVISRFR